MYKLRVSAPKLKKTAKKKNQEKKLPGRATRWARKTSKTEHAQQTAVRKRLGGALTKKEKGCRRNTPQPHPKLL